MKKIRTINLQSGAVSLFMVIFAMLLMSVVTISFLRIMTSDQNQASQNDLSQSAYDSAQAGVEDAKRALLTYAQFCKTGTAAECEQYARDLASTECNAAIFRSEVVKTSDSSDTAGGVGFPEVKVQQSSAVDENGGSIDAALDQAYTCVTMTLDTDDYTAPLRANESKLIPLVSTAPFSTVTVQWFTRSDVANTTGAVNLPTIAGDAKPLLLQANWPGDRPSVMRTQFMQVGDNFRLNDFDTRNDAGESNANTIFLYPSSNGLGSSTELVLNDRDVRRSDTGNARPADQGSAPTPIQCTSTVSAGGYACSATMRLPAPIRGGTSEASYLRLTPLYNASHIRVTLGGAQFKGVEPIVDSTGRANDLFRRVQSRIDLYDTSFPYPDAAVDVNGNFCKDFGVTDTTYIAGSCTP